MARIFSAQAESTRIGDATLGKSRRSHRPSATVCMVQAALQDLEASSRKGITLYAIKKYISTTYEIQLTGIRVKLIGNYLRSLLQAGELENVSGKGLNGHLRHMTKQVRMNERKSHLRQAKKLIDNQTLNAPRRPTKTSFHATQTTLLLETPKSSQNRKRLPSLNCSDLEPEEPVPKQKPKRRRLFDLINQI